MSTDVAILLLDKEAATQTARLSSNRRYVFRVALLLIPSGEQHRVIGVYTYRECVYISIYLWSRQRGVA